MPFNTNRNSEFHIFMLLIGFRVRLPAESLNSPFFGQFPVLSSLSPSFWKQRRPRKEHEAEPYNRTAPHNIVILIITISNAVLQTIWDFLQVPEYINLPLRCCVLFSFRDTLFARFVSPFFVFCFFFSKQSLLLTKGPKVSSKPNCVKEEQRD